MTDTIPDAPTLAAQVAWGRHQPALTAQIRDCRCSPEVKAGLYLLNGDLEAAHRTAQGIATPVGAHWHALVHRHEPDLPNSRYWQQRAGDSPIYPRLLEAAGRMGQAGKVAPEGRWDALRFTDLLARGDAEPWTREIAALELRALLQYGLDH